MALRDEVIAAVQAKVKERAERETREQAYKAREKELLTLIGEQERDLDFAGSPAGDKSKVFPTMQLLEATRELLAEHQKEAEEAYLASPEPHVVRRTDYPDMSEEAAMLQAENQRGMDMLEQAKTLDRQTEQRANESLNRGYDPAEEGE